MCVCVRFQLAADIQLIATNFVGSLRCTVLYRMCKIMWIEESIVIHQVSKIEKCLEIFQTVKICKTCRETLLNELSIVL